MRADPSTALERTPLYDLHVALGAKMVAFAGYELPVSYPSGILKEHLHTRARAGLFDVSHMGQATLSGPDHATTAAALEALVPADLIALKPGQQRYTQLLTEAGGIIDDLMVTRPSAADGGGRLLLVVNAARKRIDFAHVVSRLPPAVALSEARDQALLALQGPEAAGVLARIFPPAAALKFMWAASGPIGQVSCHVSRSGYTGEDGFEISVPAAAASDLARLLLAQEGVAPVGLGARDSLRLEAGLCLYGHDIDEHTSPVEAGLGWSVAARRRAQRGFPGAARIVAELAHGPARRRVGIRPHGRAPARDGTEILASSGERIGVVTSGGFAPSLNAPVAMGYVPGADARIGAPVGLRVRGKALSAEIVALPFLAHRYAR